MKNVIITSVLLLATGFAQAQYFQELYGTATGEKLSDGHKAYQGGSIGHFLTGPVPTVGGNTLLAERTDINGSTAPLFNNIYEFNNPNTGNVVSVTDAKSLEFSNGSGFAIVGAFYDPSGFNALYFINTDALTGAVVSVTQYHPNASFAFSSIGVTSVTESAWNSEMYVTGYVTDLAGYNHVFILKLKQNGSLIWSNIYDLNTTTSTNFDHAYDIIESSNFNGTSATYEVMVVGQYADGGTIDGFVLRVDYNTGAPTAATDIYGTAADIDYFTAIKNAANPAITATQDGYALIGLSKSSTTRDDYWFLAMDQAGAVAWSNLFDYNTAAGPSNNSDLAHDLIERNVSPGVYEYYLAGYTNNGFFGNHDVMIVRTDGAGNAVPNGQFTYGSPQIDVAFRIDDFSCTEQPGISMYGFSDNAGFTMGGYDHYLVTAQFNGVTGCNYDLINAAQSSGPGLITNFPNAVVDQLYQTNMSASIIGNGADQPICNNTASYFYSLYGTPNSERLMDGHNVYQGGTGHLLTGRYDNAAGTVTDLMVQRTDLTGSAIPHFNNLYSFTDGAANPLRIEIPHSVEFSNGTGFGLASGYYDPTSASGPGIYFLHIDGAGNIVSTSGYQVMSLTGVASYQVSRVIESVQTPGELYICGFVAFAAGGANVFILKINQAGAITWANVYDLNTSVTGNVDLAWDIVESANMNGGTYELLVVGDAQIGTSGANWDAFVMRANYNTGALIGNVQLYGGANSYERFTAIRNSANTAITATADGYILSGFSNFNNTGGHVDFWQVALDQAGNVIWTNMFDYVNTLNAPTGNQNYGHGVIERLNSCGNYEYYMVGFTNNGNMGNNDAVVVKTDQNGNGVANGQFTYGTANGESGATIDQLNGTGSDGIAIFGRADNNTGGIGAADHLLVKAYFNGVTACNFDLRTPSQNAGPGALSTLTPTIADNMATATVNAANPANGSESIVCTASSVSGGDNRRVSPGGGSQTFADPGNSIQGVQVNPNPVSNAAASLVVNSLNAQQGEVTVMDMMGRVFYQNKLQLNRGVNNIQLELADYKLRKGTYLVSVRTGTGNKKVILVVQ